MRAALVSASLAVTAGALLAGALAWVVTRRLRLALGVLLDLLTAAGLLRLAGSDSTFRALTTVAVVVAIRKVVLRVLPEDAADNDGGGTSTAERTPG